jgi:serine/threonine-protein kinase
MIGQIIGNYKIEEKLGEGGMGAVYKGVDTMLDREVAIKALRPELASQTSVVERFRSEAVTLAKLNHPNIASLYSLFREGEELYMVLEYVRGETLDTILQKRGALPAEEAIPVFCQVLDGINHAHEFGIVHRDIKPANVMLTENGKLKVLDFGIARLLGSARMTRAGNIIGTLEYMAPEQVKGGETDARSDIYSLGMMLYEVLTGKTPFDTENEFELMKLQTETMPVPPREVNPDIPEEVEAAIMQAIDKDPELRFQTAGDFLQELLDAGFSTTGTMRGITGMHRMRPNSKPSHSPVSKSRPDAPTVKKEIKQTRLGESAATTPLKPSVKETRLGASVAAAAAGASANAMKSTRLGIANETIAQVPQTAAAPAPSFMSKLTWVHYAGAGVAGLFLIGLLAIVPMFLLGGSAKGKTEEIKPVEKPAVVETKEEKPEVVTMPQPPAPQAPPATSQTTTTETNPPLQSQGTDDIKPLVPETGKLVEQPAEKPAAPKQDKPRETAVQKPAAPPKTAAPAPKKPAAKKPSAECLLTGKC